MIRKILCLSLSWLLVFSHLQISLADVGARLGLAPESPMDLRIDIPQELAIVEEIYAAPAKPDPKLILHIQNAHGNYEAQAQIKKLLDYLYKTYGFKLLFVEGAGEKLNPDFLTLFTDGEKNSELADRLARSGELTGAEYYLVDAPRDVEALGIEKAELYRANYESFKAVHEVKDQIEGFLSRLEDRLEAVSSRFFSPDARKVLSEYRKFEGGRREFLPYVNQLAVAAKKFIELDLEALFSQVEWPQLTRLLVVQSMERELEREEAMNEKTKLVTFLKEKNIRQDLIEGVENLEEKKIGMNRLNWESTNGGKLPRDLLERLVEEAGPKGFVFHDFPAFSLYAGMIILRSELDTKALFGEIERLFGKILNELTRTEHEKNVLELHRDTELLRKLLHLELTRREWARASYRSDWIQPQALMKRLEAIEKGEAYPAGESEGEGYSALSAAFMQATLFYEFARQRESVFYYTMREEMRNRGLNKAVLITGGFHTEGLMEMFREDEVNYGILTPRITEKIEASNYTASMLEITPTLFDVANLEEAAKMQSSQTLGQFGRTPAKEPRLVVSEFIEIVKKVKNRDHLRSELRALGESLYAADRSVEVIAHASTPGSDTYQFNFPTLEGKPSRFLVTFYPTDQEFGVHVEAMDKKPPFPPGTTGAIASQPIEPKVRPDVRQAEIQGVRVETGKLTAEMIKARGTRLPSPAASAIPETEFVKPGADRRLISPETGPAAVTGFDPTILGQIGDYAPDLQVLFVAGGLGPPALGRVQNADFLAKAGTLLTAFKLPEKFRAIQKIISDHSLLLPNDRVGMITVLSPRMPSPEEIEAYTGLLVSQYHQALSVIIVNDKLAGELSIQAVNDQVKAIPDIMGRPIQDRFQLEVISADASQAFLKTHLQTLSGKIYKHLLDHGSKSVPRPTALQSEHAVILIEEGLSDSLNLPETMAKIVEGKVQYAKGDRFLLTAEKIVAARLSQYGWEELDEGTKSALQRMEDTRFAILEENLGIFAKLDTALRATAEIASAA